MKTKNDVIAHAVAERKALWTDVRRSDPILQIRKVMREKHILNKDLAQRLGVTEANVSRMLKGRQNLQLDTLYQVADALEEKLVVSLVAPDALQNEILEYEAVNTEASFQCANDNVYDMSSYRPARCVKKLEAPSVAAFC